MTSYQRTISFNNNKQQFYFALLQTLMRETVFSWHFVHCVTLFIRTEKMHLLIFIDQKIVNVKQFTCQSVSALRVVICTTSHNPDAMYNSQRHRMNTASKNVSNDSDCRKLRCVAKNILTETVIIYSVYLLLSPWKLIGNIAFGAFLRIIGYWCSCLGFWNEDLSLLTLFTFRPLPLSLFSDGGPEGRNDIITAKKFRLLVLI